MRKVNHLRSQSYGTTYNHVSPMETAREKAVSAPLRLMTGSSRLACRSSVSNIQNPLNRRKQRRKLASTNEPVKHPSVSAFALVAITVNFIIGVGVLDLPHAFQDAGMILSSIIVVLALGLNYLTCYWIFDTQARAVQQTYVRSRAAEEEANILARDSSRDTLDSGSGPVLYGDQPQPIMDIIDLPNPLTCWVTLEVAELVDLFLGRAWRTVLIILIYLFQTTTLWAYAAVFSQSAATIVRPLVAIALGEPSTQEVHAGNDTNSTIGSVLTCNQEVFGEPCLAIYMSFLAAFGVAETIMIIIGIGETAALQTFLAIYRFVAILLMVLLAVVGLALDAGLQGEPLVAAPVYANAGGLGVALPAIVFALLLQMAVPSVMEPMKTREHAPRHFILSMGICAVCYILIGIVLSYYLGNQIREPITLNFATFTGYMTPEDYQNAGLGIKALVICAQYTILLFPLLDLFSAYALQGVVLCNNVLSLFPDRCLEDRHFGKIKALVTVVMSAIPIVLAAITHSLSFIINVTGTLGMLIAFTFPGMLQFQSLRVSPSRTPFTPTNKILRLLFFSQGAGVVVAILGIILFVYSLVEVFALKFT